jgi:hypothetical protein
MRWPPAAVMPVRVKNSTTEAGSDSGKKPVCVQAAELDKPGDGRLISFNVTALEFAHVSENLSVPDN